MVFHSFYLLNPRTRSSQVFPLLLFLMLIQIRLITSGPFISSCTTADNFNENTCFNDIIVFDDKKYRAGHSLTNKDNTLIIMFSDDNPGDSRLVYAIKENGRGYYANENKIKLITLTNLGTYSRHEGKINVDATYIGRYESINELVYLSDDSNREKQYLFTISSFISLSTLHDVETGHYQKWKTTSFFDIDKDHYIFSYRFSLFEWAESKVYFCVYVQYENTNNEGKDYSVSFTMSRFKFDRSTSGDDIADGVIEKTVVCNDNFNNRIVSAFYFKQYNVIAVFFAKKENPNPKITLRFYSYDLVYETEFGFDTLSNPQPGYGAFLKAVNCQHDYVGLMYYTDGNSGKSLKLKFIQVHENNGKISSKTDKGSYEFKDISFHTYILLNDFIRIDEDRYLFPATC